MFPPVARIGTLWNRSPFFQKNVQKVGLYSYAGRDEVRRVTSESAPAVKKKNDAVHTTAKFVFII